MARNGTKNFRETDGPLYRGDYAGGNTEAAREIRVVSWNIHFARKISAATTELAEQNELAGADILLLQEMDEDGVDAIAKALKYNYAYYPASIHNRTGREFGNAVLARWPLIACSKVPLPHVSPRTGEIRIATKIRLDLAGTALVAYSVHTETAALGAGKRREQFQALAGDVSRTDSPRVLVGGDFNTPMGRDVRMLDEVLGGAGLERASAGAGRTLKVGFIGFSLDHIFVRGMQAKGKGAGKRAAASDHLPVWLRLTVDTSC